MSIKADRLREGISAASVANARPVLLRMIRLSFRRRVYQYAQHHSIVDFDSVLVTQRHRNFNAATIAAAQAKATEAQNATTINELLVIFDQISPWI